MVQVVVAQHVAQVPRVKCEIEKSGNADAVSFEEKADGEKQQERDDENPWLRHCGNTKDFIPVYHRKEVLLEQAFVQNGIGRGSSF